MNLPGAGGQNSQRLARTFRELLLEDWFMKRFSFLERMKYKISGGKFIEKISETIELPKGLVDIYRETMVQLKVQETSQLETDPNVIHPCVKIHLVDLERGMYIKKEGMQPTVQQYENVAEFKDGAFSMEYCDYVLPLSTKFYDLREQTG